MTIPSLKATKLQTAGEVAVLNRWADRVKQALDDLKTTVVKKGTTITLQTQNVSNQTQDKLNLKAGTNITLTPDPFGAVVIASTAGGDGLIHGDPIWELDPAWTIFREDFNNPPSVPGPNANTTFGNGMSWAIVTSGSYFQCMTGGFPLNGFIAMSNSANPSSTAFIEPSFGGSSGSNGFPLLDYPGWKIVWIFQILRNNSASPATFAWSQVSNYVGLGNYAATTPNSTSSARPPYFLGLRYDTDTTTPSIGDNQFVFEYVSNFTTTPLTRINTQGTTFSTGITVTEGKIYRFEMSCTTKGQIVCRLVDGTSSVSNTLTVSPLSFSDKQPTFSSSNGQTGVNWASGTNLPIDIGTIVTISGGSVSAGNGTFTHQIPRGVTGELRFLNGATPTGTDTGATTSFYPALRPFFSFGNDSAAAPTVNSKGMLLDYMSLIWNKGLTGSAVSPTLARYS